MAGVKGVVAGVKGVVGWVGGVVAEGGRCSRCGSTGSLVYQG